MPEQLDFDLDVYHFLARWPCAARVFIKHGMACVGCEMGRFETLQEVSEVYGLAYEAFKAEILEACRASQETAKWKVTEQ